MAVPFLAHHDPRTMSSLRAAGSSLRPAGAPPHPATRRPTLVALEGGRSAAALRRRNVFLVRRLVVLVAAVMAITLAGSAVSSLVGGASPSSVPATYQVEPGDTLWSIVGTIGVDADRREVVRLLSDANGGTVVVPGQHLVIPESVRAMG